MVGMPLHNLFLRDLFKQDKSLIASVPDYKTYTQGLRRSLIEAQRFALDTHATWEIVDRADLDVKHLMDRVQLAHLPYEKVWIEYNQHDKIEANFYAGRGPKPLVDEVAPLAGFLIKRVDGRPDAWIAQKVQALDNGEVLPRHGLDLFEYLFDASSAYPIKRLAGSRSVLDDGVFSAEVETIATTLWGKTALLEENDTLNEARNKGGLAVSRLWRGDVVGAISSDPRNKTEHLRRATSILSAHMREMIGELRFLVTAIALMNEVPIIVSDDVRPQKPTFLAGGRMQPYLTHRTVRINVPAIKKKGRTVSEILYEAGSKKRRHMVRRHQRTYLNPDGSIRKIKWIEEHERGDASLGWVTHDYAVGSKQRKARTKLVDE